MPIGGSDEDLDEDEGDLGGGDEDGQSQGKDPDRAAKLWDDHSYERRRLSDCRLKVVDYPDLSSIFGVAQSA